MNNLGDSVLAEVARNRLYQYAKGIKRKFNDRLSEEEYRVIAFVHYFNFIYNIPTLIKSLERTNFNFETFKYNPTTFCLLIASKDDLGKVIEVDAFYSIDFDISIEGFPICYLAELINSFLVRYDLGNCVEMPEENNKNRKWGINIKEVSVEAIVAAYQEEMQSLLVWYADIIKNPNMIIENKNTLKLN